MCFFCQYSPICTTMQMSRQRLRTAAIMMKRLRPSLVARTSTCRSELQNLSRLHRQGHTIEPILNTLRQVMFDTEMIISRKSCFSHTSVHHVRWMLFGFLVFRSPAKAILKPLPLHLVLIRYNYMVGQRIIWGTII